MREVSVRQLMTTSARSVRSDTDVQKIAALLYADAVGAVPVLDENEHLVGIVTEADLPLEKGFRSGHLPTCVPDSAEMLIRLVNGIDDVVGVVNQLTALVDAPHAAPLTHQVP
jgi:CBS-domain-containing membrane protein